MTGSCDVAVIGAGPAGLTAARRLAGAGLAVTLIDEQPQFGGQYYRRPAAAVAEQFGDHRPDGARLVAGVRSAGVDGRAATSVWGVADDRRTLLLCPSNGAGPVTELSARYIVVATGAYERVIPFRGWELPGVTTAGFAQHLATDHTAVGKRVLLAGSGPFLLSVACRLLTLGISVVGIAEAGRPYRPAWAKLSAARHTARMAEFLRYAATLVRHHVPVWQGRVVLSADPDASGAHVGSVTLASTADPAQPVATVEVDALCVGMGFRPQAELVRLLGCVLRVDPRSGDAFPVTDDQGQSSRPDVFVAGEAAGIGGAQLAMAEGDAVATAILHREGRVAVAGTGRSLRRARKSAALIARIYPSAGELTGQLTAALDDSVNVCRCEAVTAGAVRAATALAGRDVAAVKGLSRAGMGLCQGRECAATVTALSGADPAAPFAAQFPVRPLSLGSIAALEHKAHQSEAHQNEALR